MSNTQLIYTRITSSKLNPRHKPVSPVNFNKAHKEIIPKLVSNTKKIKKSPLSDIGTKVPTLPLRNSSSELD